MPKNPKKPEKKLAKRPEKKPAKKAFKPRGKLAAKRIVLPPPEDASSSSVLDRLYNVVESRMHVDPAISHSARLLSRGTAKVAQKFGEEAVECLIEAVAGNAEALVAESADVLYHLLVMWVDAGVRPDEVWRELQRREGVSGIAEKAGRALKLPRSLGVASTKIP